MATMIPVTSNMTQAKDENFDIPVQSKNVAKEIFLKLIKAGFFF